MIFKRRAGHCTSQYKKDSTTWSSELDEQNVNDQTLDEKDKTLAIENAN